MSCHHVTWLLMSVYSAMSCHHVTWFVDVCLQCNVMSPCDLVVDVWLQRNVMSLHDLVCWCLFTAQCHVATWPGLLMSVYSAMSWHQGSFLRSLSSWDLVQVNWSPRVFILNGFTEVDLSLSFCTIIDTHMKQDSGHLCILKIWNALNSENIFLTGGTWMWNKTGMGAPVHCECTILKLCNDETHFWGKKKFSGILGFHFEWAQHMQGSWGGGEG